MYEVNNIIYINKTINLNWDNRQLIKKKIVFNILVGQSKRNKKKKIPHPISSLYIAITLLQKLTISTIYNSITQAKLYLLFQAIVALTFAKYAAKPFFPDCVPPDNAVTLLAAVCLCKFV